MGPWNAPSPGYALYRGIQHSRESCNAPHSSHAPHYSRLPGKWAGTPVGGLGTSSLLQHCLHKHSDTHLFAFKLVRSS